MALNVAAMNAGATSKFGALTAALITAARRAAGEAPTYLMPAGTMLLRAVSAQYAPLLKTPTGQTVGFISAEQARQARTPRDVLAKSTNNRWSGWGPGGHVAGLYLSVSSAALAAELAHYQKGKVAEAFTAAKPALTLIRFRVLRSLLLIDFSKSSGHADKFFALLGEDAGVKEALWAKALRARSIKELAFASDDYSVARGIGIGLALATKPSYDGLLVRSARGDPQTRFDGDNVVLFGSADKPHDALALDEIIELNAGGTIDRIRQTKVRP